MKKEMIIIMLIVTSLLIFPIVQAEEQTQQQEQVQTYSGFNRLTDDIKLTFSGGDNKVRLALEIREKEVDSAINNIQNQGEDKAIENLERARKKLQIVQEKVSLNTSEEIKTSVDEVIDKVNEEENLPDEFEDYLLEEQKTQLTAVLTEKTFEYCTELAKEDFALMLKEEGCNPDTAIPGLEKELEKLKDLQLRMFVQLMLEIRSCIDDPGTCNCEANVDVEQKAKCEKMVALAIKCEYKEDETSCDELESMKPTQGDSFAESFVPDFLMNLFREKSYMVEYGIEPSDGVPEECWDDNDKPECEQYDYLKETKDDWDEYGNFIGKRPENKEPTMRESIPQCFDENDNFLEEKCGKITIVKSEEGLTNYLIEKEIDNIINDFENKSAQNIIPDTIDEGEWTIDEGEGNVEISNKAREIKRDMNQITNQIKDITYAIGTGPGGDGEICCKKIMSGETKYKWDYKEDCVSPEDIEGEVVDDDFCLALGTAIDEEEDTQIWGDGNDGGDAGVTMDGDGQDVVTNGDGQNVDGGGSNVVNDVVDEGPGEPGVVDED